MLGTMNLDTAITAMSALMHRHASAIGPIQFTGCGLVPSGELAAPTNDINVTTFAGFVEYKGR